MIQSYTLALLLLARNGPTGAQDASWVKLAEAAKPCVVVIRTEKGIGTGFIVRSNGVIATNLHVVRDASQVLITLANNETYDKAYVLAEEVTKDIAILKIDAVDLTALPAGNSNNVRVGEEVLLISTPRGLEQTVSSGIVSSLRLLEGGVRVVQTTAPASPGSSGGPLLNRAGEAIGILTFGVVEGQNLNFAVPINYLRGILDNISIVPPLKPLRTMSRLVLPSESETASARDATGVAGAIGSSDSVLFFAYRTQSHITYSSAEVFQRVVDSLILFMKSQDIALANDKMTQPMQTQELASVYQVVQFNNRYVGASHILFLTVERPTSAWIKLRLQCLDRNGKQQWEEVASKTSWVSSNIQPTIENLEKAINKHLRELPSVKVKAESTPRDPSPHE